MNFEKGCIEGLLIIKPSIYEDDRGYFFESFNKKIWEDFFKDAPVFVQDNESLSFKNVLRGLHFQNPPFAQGKLIRVTNGSVLDVAVDLRKNSPTYGQHQKIILSAENKLQFYIPEGFAHGFLALEDDTQFNYKCTNFYSAESEDSINWNDEDLDIDWGINDPIISEKDINSKRFINFNSPF